MSIYCHARRARRALSFMEFLGCLSALIGGTVLGSMYLGVDVKETTLGFLHYAQTAAAQQQALPAANATASPGLVDGQALAQEPAQTALSQTAAAKGESAAINPQQDQGAPPPASDAGATETQPALADVLSLTDEQREQLTRDYWNAFNACTIAEAEHRTRSAEPGGEAGMYEYLARRAEAHHAAGESIAQLSLRGVDSHVAEYAKRVQAWHEEGAELFAQAKDLLTDAPTAQLSGPFAQDWQSAATQHQMEERLLTEKHVAVQTYLDHAGLSKDDAAAAGN